MWKTPSFPLLSPPKFAINCTMTEDQARCHCLNETDLAPRSTPPTNPEQFIAATVMKRSSQHPLCWDETLEPTCSRSNSLKSSN